MSFNENLFSQCAKKNIERNRCFHSLWTGEREWIKHETLGTTSAEYSSKNSLVGQLP